MQKYKLLPWRNLPKFSQRILKNATPQVMVLTGIGMSFSLLVDILIAARLGTTLATDALIIALSIPRMIETIGREGTRFSLVTLFVAVHEKQTETEFLAFFSGLLNLFFVLGFVFALVGILLAPYIILLIGPGLSIKYQQQATFLFRSAIWLVVFTLGATVLEAALNSQNHFIVVASRNLVLSGTVTLAIILGWNRLDFSIWIASAYSVGYFLFFVWLFWYSHKRAGIVYTFNSWPDKSYSIQIWRSVFYPTTSTGIRLLSRVAERAIASTLLPGGVAIYYFAFRLVSAAQSIIGISIATTGLPNLSRLALEDKYDLFLKAVYRQVKRAALVGLPASLFIVLFYRTIVNLLYNHGNIGESSVEQIGLVLQTLGGALFFWLLISVFSSGLYAYRKYHWVLYNVIVTVVINLSLAWILAQFIGVQGIALATTISIMLSALNLYLMLLILIRKRWKADDSRI